MTSVDRKKLEKKKIKKLEALTVAAICGANKPKCCKNCKVVNCANKTGDKSIIPCGSLLMKWV